jgi:putative solute:sodium symporter small subunit
MASQCLPAVPRSPRQICNRRQEAENAAGEASAVRRGRSWRPLRDVLGAVGGANALPKVATVFEPIRHIDRKSSKLALGLLAAWISYSFTVHSFVVPLNKIIIPILGLPLGFYMAVQGSLVVFLLLLFWFGRRAS